MAAGAAALMAIPAIVIAGFLPTALLQIGPALPIERVRAFLGWFVPLYAVLLALLAATILLAGVVRAFVQRSPAAARGAVACVLLTGLNPLLAVFSTPVSINWSGIGMIAGFFCFFGVFASLITLATDYFFPNVPSYSAWHGFAVARYLLAVLGGFGVLALVRHFLVAEVVLGTHQGATGYRALCRRPEVPAKDTRPARRVRAGQAGGIERSRDRRPQPGQHHRAGLSEKLARRRSDPAGVADHPRLAVPAQLPDVAAGRAFRARTPDRRRRRSARNSGRSTG